MSLFILNKIATLGGVRPVLVDHDGRIGSDPYYQVHKTVIL